MKVWMMAVLACGLALGCIVDNSPTPDDMGEPEPETPEPDTPEPDTPEPDTPEPDTPEPDTPEPDAPEPNSPEPERWTCEDVCDRILLDCLGGTTEDALREECAESCRETNPSQALLECTFTTPCNQLEICDELESPRRDVATECAEVCLFAVDCEFFESSERERALAQCEAGCIEESTPEERACLLALDACDPAPDCFEEQ